MCYNLAKIALPKSSEKIKEIVLNAFSSKMSI